MKLTLPLLCAFAPLAALPARAETLIAAHTIRARAVLGPEDISQIAADVPGALSAPEEALGKEARVVLYAGRPIRSGDVGLPAVIERNQRVKLAYARGALTILAEGRALARAGVGEAVRVMNTGSHSTVTGIVQSDGSVAVGQ